MNATNDDDCTTSEQMKGNRPHVPQTYQIKGKKVLASVTPELDAHTHGHPAMHNTMRAISVYERQDIGLPKFQSLIMAMRSPLLPIQTTV